MERRYSRQRESILNVLRATRCHPDAEYVYGEVKKEIPNISLGTVYRNLGEMVKWGEIACIQTVDNRVRYDYNTQPHQHFVCRMCGAITDLEIETDLEEQARAQGYEVEETQIVMSGVCPKCGARGQ